MEKITAKFSCYGYFIFLLTLIVGVTMSLIGSRLILNDFNDSTTVYVFFILMFFTWGWLNLVELNNKISKITIQNGQITINPYLGLGKPSVYWLKEFNDIKISVKSKPFRKDPVEYLYLMKGDKCKAVLSSTYYANYYELKSIIKADFKEYKTKF